jgi:hypothetical protein
MGSARRARCTVRRATATVGPAPTGASASAPPTPALPPTGAARRACRSRAPHAAAEPSAPRKNAPSWSASIRMRGPTWGSTPTTRARHRPARVTLRATDAPPAGAACWRALRAEHPGPGRPHLRPRPGCAQHRSAISAGPCLPTLGWCANQRVRCSRLATTTSRRRGWRGRSSRRTGQLERGVTAGYDYRYDHVQDCRQSPQAAGRQGPPRGPARRGGKRQRLPRCSARREGEARRPGRVARRDAGGDGGGIDGRGAPRGGQGAWDSSQGAPEAG